MRDNKDIAAVFAEMADLLDIDGGDRYRIRAFRRVARVLENLREPVSSKMRFGELENVPGIGEGAVHRIKQILRTGTCDEHARLRGSLPSGLRELLKVKGIGVRTVRYLWGKKRIGSIADLEAAARAGRLDDVPGFGERSADKILQAIERARHEVGKMPLAEALATGFAMRDALRAVPEVTHCELTGSARRARELVEDLDFVVGATDPIAVVSKFVILPEVDQILMRGDGIASVLLHSGRQADLWVVQPEQIGAGLHAYSGSQQHVVYIRARGNRRRIKISEKGIFRREDGAPISSCPAEEDVFAAVGLPFIPPELRENTGEIEAAERGRLPKLVDDGVLRGDPHVVTRGRPEPFAESAARLGWSWLANTEPYEDHGGDRDEYVERIHRTRPAGVRLLAGVEIAIMPDGSLDTIDLPHLAGFDWVVAVPGDDDLPPKEATARLVKAIESGAVDLIAHPTGRVLGERPALEMDLEKVLKAARRAGVALEINAHPMRMDLDSTAIRFAKDLGVPLAISSFAHEPGELSRASLGVRLARRGWIERKDLLNALSADELLARRKDRRRKPSVAVPGEPEPPVEEPRETPADRVAALARALGERPLAPELVERLDYFFREGGDELLTQALATLSPNPLGKAYELLVLSASPLTEEPAHEPKPDRGGNRPDES